MHQGPSTTYLSVLNSRILNHDCLALGTLSSLYYFVILAVDLCANQVYEGSSKARTPDCSITLPDETFVDLIGGKLDTKEVRQKTKQKQQNKTALTMMW